LLFIKFKKNPGSQVVPTSLQSLQAGGDYFGDVLPFFVLAAIVLCFLVYYSGTSNKFASRAQGLRAKALVAQAKEMPDDVPFSLEVCNQTAAVAFVAVAYFDTHLQDFVARGWFPQKPGGCRRLLTGLTGDVYLFSDKSPANIHAQAVEDGSVESFCISSEQAFVLPQRVCTQHDFSTQQALKKITRWEVFTRLSSASLAKAVDKERVLTWSVP
jgi:uncharacterized membrane protein